MEPLNQIINSVMETAILYFMTIRMIRINNYALTRTPWPVRNFASIDKGSSSKPEEKLSNFETNESDHKFGHGDYHTIFYNHKNDLDQ